MIGSLDGHVAEIGTGGELVVVTAGIGWRVTCSTAAAAQVAGEGERVLLAVHTHVSDQHGTTLYGFAGRDERNCFEALLKVHQVGPSLAMAVISALGVEGFCLALQRNDVASLASVPGVGPKTALRITQDCKTPEGILFDAGGEPKHDTAVEKSPLADALEEMGFTPGEIAVGVQAAGGNTENFDTALKKALAAIGAGR